MHPEARFKSCEEPEEQKSEEEESEAETDSEEKVEEEEEKEVEEEKTPPDPLQCAKDPRCTRGFEHGRRGGRCTIMHPTIVP